MEKGKLADAIKGADTFSQVTPNTEANQTSERPSTSAVDKPTLANQQRHSQRLAKESPRFSESNSPSIKNSVKAASPALVAAAKLKDFDPEQRAKVGSRLGAGLGMAVQGTIGGVLGAAIGAYAGRGAGLVQAGIHESNQRKTQVLDAFDRLGIRNKKNGAIEFSDGGSSSLTPDRVFGNEQGQPGKADIEQIDMTSPFARRTTAVARPLARYITEGLLGFGDDSNEADVKSIDSTTAMLINSLQDGATDIETVYNRAREISKKIGISPKQAREFFHQKRGAVEEKERVDIEKGLEILYGKV